MTKIYRISIRQISEQKEDPFLNFCDIIGVSSNLDKNNTAMRIIDVLHRHGALNSTEIGRLTNMSRGAVLNHLENLIDTGIVFRYAKNYHLRDRSFSNIVDSIERDINQTINELRRVAKEIDKNLRD